MRRLLVMSALSLAVAACAQLPGVSATPSPEGSRPQPTETIAPNAPLTAATTVQASSALTSQAEALVDQIIATQRHGYVVGAAYVQTTMEAYEHSLPDRAGLPSAPTSSDIVLIVEVLGWFPGAHAAPCCDPRSSLATGIVAVRDVTLGLDLGWTFLDDPTIASPSALPAPSAVTFPELSRLGTPILVATPSL